MPLTALFSRLLRQFREARGLSQDQLAVGANLDRSYVSQLERGLKSPTLDTVERLTHCLGIAPFELVREVPVPEEAQVTISRDYVHSSTDELTILRPDGTNAQVKIGIIFEAIDVAHDLIDQLYAFDLDIAAVLGMRNLSAFVGELVAAAMARVSNGLLRPNPHQDGYPDLLLMDTAGRRRWLELERYGTLADKRPFSPFSAGGIEVKATCGSIPSPAACLKRGARRPGIGDRRIDCLKGYDWKAHHRDTNDLIGVLWDFLGGRPRVVALFYSCDLVAADWGKLVQPKEGGGKTTSVSIMAPSGIRKLYQGWLCVLADQRYVTFLNQKNKGSLVPSKGN